MMFALTGVLGLLVTGHGSSLTDGLPPPNGSVPLVSEKGRMLLLENMSTFNTYTKVVNSFETQVTQSFCGVASACSILNALPNVNAPIAPKYYPYAYFTQEAFFSTSCVQNITTYTKVLEGGMTLEQFASAVTCWLQGTQVSVEYTNAQDSNVLSLHNAAVAALANGKLMAVNFARAGLVEVGGGHFSPIGGYAPTSQMFLILDVSRYKYPPVWVSTAELFGAMNTTDTSSGKSRGWAFVG
eukprot:m.147072 g.147072  ORF g.147072 m.147072 type:complete len:241 (+) comp14982_c0_seq1:47-769(+)